jgi:hypothetical protein
MIELRRALRYKDTLKLPTGHEIEINFNAEARGIELLRAQNALIKAVQAAKDHRMTDAEREEYESAYYALIEVIVGERNAKRILNAYEGDREEMIGMLDPWIAEHIIPLGLEASRRIRARKEAEYKRGRK